MQQRSPEWYDARKGKIGGTRFGQVISGKKNRLIYELLDEDMSEFLFPDDFVSDEMQFGIDNEPIARDMYIRQTGINFREVGLIQSDFSSIHIASPDGLSDDNTKVLEIKCTMDGSIHLQRFFEGVENSYMPQIKNYFAVSDEVKEVHWVSYCPDRPERPIIVYIFTREHFSDIEKGRDIISQIEAKLSLLKQEWTF